MREIEGLRARREILRDQLERATNRRDELANQLNETVETGARAGIQERLNLLDQRILQLERDQAVTERTLSSTPPGILAETREQSQHHAGMVHEDEAAGIAFATFGVGVVLTLLVGRFRRRRSARRPGGQVTAPALADDPRVERLAQAVDAIAVEVERIGEGQRFVTHLLSSRRDAVPAVTAEMER
jgi:hypothetical protein